MARKVYIDQKTKAQINTGGVDVGTSVVQLSSDGRQLLSGVQIVADSTNGGVIYIGVRPTVTAGTDNVLDGFPLAASESLLIPVDREDQIYMIGDQASLGVHFISF